MSLRSYMQEEEEEKNSSSSYSPLTYHTYLCRCFGVPARRVSPDHLITSPHPSRKLPAGLASPRFGTAIKAGHQEEPSAPLLQPAMSMRRSSSSSSTGSDGLPIMGGGMSRGSSASTAVPPTMLKASPANSRSSKRMVGSDGLPINYSAIPRGASTATPPKMAPTRSSTGSRGSKQLLASDGLPIVEGGAASSPLRGPARHASATSKNGRHSLFSCLPSVNSKCFT